MAVDPAFKGVGKKEGLEIFRIEVCTPVYTVQLANKVTPVYHVILKTCGM